MGNGLIMARWRQGEAKYPGILDGYAFFIWGLLECYGACYDAEYLEKAEFLGEHMLDQFFLQKAFHPAGHGFFLHVLQEERRGQLIGVGEESIRDEKMSYLNLDILIKTRGCQEKIEKLAPFLKDYPIPEKGNDFYFCQNHVCSEVVHSLDEVQKIVDIFLQ